MDDVLGDFFSEIEKVEVETVAAKDDSSTGVGVGVGAGTSSVGNHPSTSSAVSGTVRSAVSNTVSSAVSKVDGSHTVSVEVKSAKPVPNITYVAASKPVTVTAEPTPTTTSSIAPPPAPTHTHTHTHTTTSSSSSSSSSRAPVPPTPYGAVPFIMTGAQMQAAMQPAAPLPHIPTQQKKFVRSGAGEVWVDDTLNEWPANDFRLFVGDLGNEVTTEMLAKEFQKYKTFAKAKVVRGGWNNKSKGYGFVSFIDPFDCAKALREMNGKYLGNRPMKIRKSTWKDNDINEVKKKEKKKRKIAESLGLA